MITDRKSRRRRELALLASQGMDVARELHAQAKNARSSKELVELALAFDDVARSIRRSIELEAKLARERPRDAAADSGATGEPEEVPMLPLRRRLPPDVH